eukprot:Phypoly_transcript_02750.p1 GENE.Phypoly_transcript_02750~~Phypoly_transcript_02750.p1  ORF type:complete len:836 (+),score=180.82 Phypoly_transcript_02750:116-2623(+)
MSATAQSKPAVPPAGSDNTNNNSNDPISAIPYDSTSFSPQLTKLISELVKTNDPLDQPNFDRIAYINSLFPDVLSLVSLDPAVAKLRAKVAKMDDEIVKEVRNQSNVGVRGKKDLEDAKKSVNELFGKVKDIKEKAEKSEQMVMDITKDIKSLDHAKKYLSTSIKYLKQLRMQISDVEQLKLVVPKRKYREIGNLLEIVLERQQGFAAHSNIPKIKSLGAVIESLKAELTKIIYDEFARFDAQQDGKASPHLGDVCFVVDALGHHLKDEFVTKFVDGQLKDYRDSFGTDRELESIKNRYYWLQCELKYFDDNYAGVFPPSWRMSELISEEFCIATRLAISEVLESTKKTLDVVALIRAVERTIEFERLLSERFRKRTGLRNSNSFDEEELESSGGAGEEEEASAGGGGFDVEAIRKRWQIHKQHRERDQEQRQLQQMQKQEEEALQAQGEGGGEGRPPTNFKGIISSCFDPYMDLYITQEDRNMKEMIDNLIADETWEVPEETRNKVLVSSTDLIYYFNEARKRCAKLTRGQPFFDLFVLFKKYLKNYAYILNSRLPLEGTRILTEDESRRMCVILNTAEYCLTTITQMKEIITRMIDDPFKDKIDLQPETDEYSNIVAKGLKILVSGLEAKIEPAMNTMRSLPWYAEDGIVGEESPYVNEIDAILAAEVPRYRGILGTGHFNYFCDLFVGSFIPRLIQTIYKLRRISELGAQKLLLDVTMLRKVFVMMPTFGLTDGTTAPARFIRLVNKEISKAEILLKALLIPASTPDKLVEMFRSSVPDATDNDFARVLELKGFKAKEKDDIMARYINTLAGGARVPRDALQRLVANVFQNI